MYDIVANGRSGIDVDKVRRLLSRFHAGPCKLA